MMLLDVQIHAPLVIAAGAVFIPVCSTCVALRVYARRSRGIKLGPDDWTIIIALIFVIAMGVTLIAEVGLKQLGYAAPEPSTVIGKPDANVAFWPGELLQIWALGFVKLSLIFFYRRVFSKKVAPMFNIITWAAIAMTVVWTISFFFSILFICGTDFEAYWQSTIVEKAHCVNTNMLHNAFAISDVVTDIIIAILPIPMVLKLNLTLGRKIGVLAIFGLGALTIATSIVRMVVFIQATTVQYDPLEDFEYICTAGLYWSMLESGLGLCAACLPAQYSLFSTTDLQSIIRSVQSRNSLRSTRSTSQNLSPTGSNNLRTEAAAWASDTQNITAHAKGPGHDEIELESGIGKKA